MSDIAERLEQRAISYEESGPSAHHTAALLREAADEIERLRKERDELRRWKALDKPLTAAMSIAQAEISKIRVATIEECAQIIAGRIKFCLSIGWELGAEELEIVATALRALKEQP